MAEKWKKMLNSRWFKAIVCLVIAAFCFTVYQVYHKTIFAKMVVSAVVPYHPSQLGMANNPERWILMDKANDYYYGEVEKHITEFCGVSSRNKGLDEVIKIAASLKNRTFNVQTTQVPNYSFDYFQFFNGTTPQVREQKVACGIYVSIFHHALTSLGYVARRIDLSNDEHYKEWPERLLANFRNPNDNRYFDRHTALEYFDPGFNKWIYVDGWYGILIYKSRGDEPHLDAVPLSIVEAQDVRMNIRLARLHSLHRPYSVEEYSKYLSQVAMGKNTDPAKKLSPFFDEYGSSYRSYTVRNSDRSSLYQRFNWEFKTPYSDDEERKTLEMLRRTRN